MRGAAMPATMLPAAPQARSRPKPATPMPRRSWAYKTNGANATKYAALKANALIASPRRTRSRRRNRKPSATGVERDAERGRDGTKHRSRAETPKETASAKNGRALDRPKAQAPSGGPASDRPSASILQKRPLADVNVARSGPTTSRSSDTPAGVKKHVATPTKKTTAASEAILARPVRK